MTTTKTKGKGNGKADKGKLTVTERKADALPEVKRANAEGLTGFDAKIIETSLKAAFEQAKTAKAAQEAKAKAALILCRFAYGLRQIEANLKMTAEDWAAGWRYEMKAILPRLHKAGIGWIDTRTAKEDGRTLYSLTSYGQNVSSTANMVGQYADVLESELFSEENEEASYTQVVKAIRDAKAKELAETLTDEEKELAAALELFQQGMDIFAKQIEEAASLGVTERAIEEIHRLIAREATESTVVANKGKPKPVAETDDTAESIAEVTEEVTEETVEPVAAVG